MSIRVMSHVWDHSQQKGSSLLVLLALADFADDEGNCFPSIARLAAKARIGERAAQMAVRHLVAAGELSIEEGGGRHKVNRYTVQMVHPYKEETAQDMHPKRRNRAQTMHPNEPQKGANDDIKRVQSTTETVHERAPLIVSINRQLEPSEVNVSHETLRRPRDRGWEILSEFCGYEPRDVNERKLRNAVLKHLRSELKASDDDIALACQRYCARWPEMERTAPAIAKHFERMLREPARASPNHRNNGHQPDYSGIDEFSRRMDAIEARGQDA